MNECKITNISSSDFEVENGPKLLGDVAINVTATPFFHKISYVSSCESGANEKLKHYDPLITMTNLVKTSILVL